MTDMLRKLRKPKLLTSSLVMVMNLRKKILGRVIRPLL